MKALGQVVIGAALFIFQMAVVGCGYRDTSLPAAPGVPAGAPPAGAPPQGPGKDDQNSSTREPGFAEIRDQVFRVHCFACHSDSGGNKGRVNLETYANVFPIVQVIVDEVSSGSMPPFGAMPESAKLQLINWVRIGAPESRGQP